LPAASECAHWPRVTHAAAPCRCVCCCECRCRYQRAYDTLVKSLQDLGAITNIYNVVNEYA